MTTPSDNFSQCFAKCLTLAVNNPDITPPRGHRNVMVYYGTNRPDYRNCVKGCENLRYNELLRQKAITPPSFPTQNDPYGRIKVKDVDFSRMYKIYKNLGEGEFRHY